MIVSELISELQRFIDQHGDLEVDTLRFDGHRKAHVGPRVDFRKVLSGRESRPDFASSRDKKGEKVCRM